MTFRQSRVRQALRLMILMLAFGIAACRDSGQGNYVRLAGNVFIFNYREAVATYVLTLQRLREIPPDTEIEARFDNPEGGEPLIKTWRVWPGSNNIAVESDPVFCIEKGKLYEYTVRLLGHGVVLQEIKGKMISTLSQDVLPLKPLVTGPGYEPNDGISPNDEEIRRKLKITRCNLK